MKRIILAVFFLFLVGLPSFIFGQVTASNTPKDNLYNDQGVLKRTPMPLPSIRKADIMWSKRILREIDFRQKMNNVFYFPITPHQNWRSFITVILDALKQGKITAYRVNPQTDELLVPITYNEIMTEHTDTNYTQLPSTTDPTVMHDTAIPIPFRPEVSVKRLRLKEDWYFDSKRSQMLVRIEALCPIYMKVPQGGGPAQPEPLFWISYADARKVLAQALAFNPDNSAMRLSFDDIFIKRLFESYIIKEQNIFDRSIREYASGAEAIRESNRVKREMFNFEQYLWQY